jgi:hypothetical protein
MKVDPDILSIDRGLLLFVRGLVVRTPSLDRRSSRGAEAPLLHRISYVRPAIRHVDRCRNTDMKPQHPLACIAAVVTAAAAIGMFLGPARADAADHQPDADYGMRYGMGGAGIR